MTSKNLDGSPLCGALTEMEHPVDPEELGNIVSFTNPLFEGPPCAEPHSLR